MAKFNYVHPFPWRPWIDRFSSAIHLERVGHASIRDHERSSTVVVPFIDWERLYRTDHHLLEIHM